MTCNVCSKENSENARFCVHCGNFLIDTCPTCGKSVSIVDGFCSFCGELIYIEPAAKITVQAVPETKEQQPMQTSRSTFKTIIIASIIGYVGVTFLSGFLYGLIRALGGV